MKSYIHDILSNTWRHRIGWVHLGWKLLGKKCLFDKPTAKDVLLKVMSVKRSECGHFHVLPIWQSHFMFPAKADYGEIYLRAHWFPHQFDILSQSLAMPIYVIDVSNSLQPKYISAEV